MPEALPYGRADNLEQTITTSVTAIEMTGLEPFARSVGVIVAYFASIEALLPKAVAKLSGMSAGDAVTTVGVFRAFSNRITILDELAKARSGTEREVFSYAKGLFQTANTIRNNYAHARYRLGLSGGAVGTGKVFIAPYSNEANERELTLSSMTKDILAIRRALCELRSMFENDQLPPALYDKLFPQSG